MDVKVYSTPTCPYCQVAKDYLSSGGIAYTDYDVSKDQSAAEEMIEVSGQMGVPVIVIDQDVIIGFDNGHIDALLEK